MIRLPQSRLFLVAVVLSVVLLPGIARAQVTVTPTVLFDGTLYHYDYTVTNLTSFDLAIVDVHVAAQADAVQNPTAPPGFITVFDPGVGIVSFLEDFDPATPSRP
jgi:hypothetical protein